MGYVLKNIERYETLNPDLKDYSKQQYTIENPEFFSDIFNIVPSYWLGFLTDGWLAKDTYTIGLAISMKDEEHLNAFADKIGFARDKIFPFPSFRPYNGEIIRYEVGQIRFICKPMWTTLRELGLFGSKSENGRVPAYVKYAIEMAKKEVNDLDIHWSETEFGKIVHAWLLGVYDADGSHRGSYSAIIRVSNQDLLLEIQDLFESPNPVQTEVEPGTVVRVFDKFTMSKGMYRLTLGPDIFKRMLLSYTESLDRKRP